ncbi:SRPBCC family protein [Roseobacter denitrificans]|uniref:SRPBCC family protein n=1 Tax=Roseobacter denitrificans (strain ATCC 33942 / OCh 114) TaxID=375451 RepID=Q16AT7_ROSDO|nr:SRPBCC family protein [Roseobacter denitrificans]ABG30906.1 hypothetical protein RD1_1260 [Roseobacter denitrificans OCh 114]AVL54000.1 SRPBCC family protein [Roseobacter denitrificans]SFG14374.1 Polyketide cyclase / dehydrase and lipid transport [Roseobacter denitrificans OCh 114]
MDISLSKEIDAPAAFVFQAVTDFERFEKVAIARGVKVHRRAAPSDAVAGPVWDVQFLFHGKALDLTLAVTDLMAPDHLVMSVLAKSFKGRAMCQLSPRETEKTQMTLSFMFEGQTLSGRLFLKALEVTKATMEQKIAKRMADFARETESAYRATV